MAETFKAVMGFRWYRAYPLSTRYAAELKPLFLHGR